MISYLPSLVECLVAEQPHQKIDLGVVNPSVLYLLQGASACAVIRGHHGAPMAAVQLEELIALGFQRFLTVGPAGHPFVGEPTMTGGSFCLPEQAFIEEGTSRHYCPGSHVAEPHPGSVAALREIMARQGYSCVHGPIVTTDALYRETNRFIMKIVGRGVVAVDMECSALFTVASFYGKEIASLLYISDLVDAGGTWHLGVAEQDHYEVQRRLAAIIKEYICR